MKCRINGTSLITSVLFGLLCAPWGVRAAPESLTYQGRILKTDGTPLEYSNVSFQFEITNPNGQCIIYREQVDHVDLTNSNGVFDVPIGGGAQSHPNNGTFTLLDAFNNSTTFTCAGGSGAYNAASGDQRRLRVRFHDGSGWKTISPDNVIRSVPFAAYSKSAEKLGTHTASEFVLKNAVTACPANSFLTFDGTNFSCQAVSGASGGTVTAVTSANSYLSVTNGTSTPQLTLNVGTAAGTVAAGNDARFSDSRPPSGAASGDLSGSFPGPSVVKLRGVDVANAVPSLGQYLRHDGTSWTPAGIAISDVTNLSATLSNHLTNSAFNAAVDNANCAAHQTAYWNSVAGEFLCQAINVSVAGDVSGTIGAVSVDKIKGVAVDTTVPTMGQVLKFDGTKWAPAPDNSGAGTVTSVSGTLPISVATGNSTPVISISQSGATTDGYLSSTDWNSFNSKQPAGNYVTSLTGDVTATGPGTAAATVAKLQGQTLTLTTPSNGEYLRFNGTAIVNAPLSATDLSGSIPATSLPAFSGDVTSTAGSSVLSLANTGTAGTYFKVTTDGKGRVTAGTSSLISADIPALDWSKITTGKPTTLAGYGITDALISNAGGTPSIQTGTDASKPASPPAGAIYFAADTKTIYQFNSGSWVSIASINASAAPSGTAGGDLSGTYPNPTIGKLNGVGLTLSGPSSGQVIKYNGTAWVNALLSATDLPTVPVNKGGTGQTSYVNGELLIGNSTGNTLSKATLTAGSGINIANGAGSITISTTGAAPTGSASGDLSGSYPSPTVAKIQGYAVDTTAPTTNSVMKWDGSKWMSSSVKLSELTNLTGGSAFNTGTCTAAQTLNWSSITDKFECQNIAIANTQVSGLGTASTRAAGTAANEVLLLDGSGRIPASVLPSTLGQWQASGTKLYYDDGVIVAGGSGTTYTGTNQPFIVKGDPGQMSQLILDRGSSLLMMETNGLQFSLGKCNSTTCAGMTQYLYANFTSNRLDLGAGASGSNGISLLSSGFAGFGTQSPSYRIDIQSSEAFQQRLFHASDADYNGAALMLTRTRGTVSSNTAVNSGNTIGGLYFRAHDGSGTGTTNAAIEVSASENQTTTTRGSHMVFETTNIGSATRTEKMRIAGNGNVGIGTSSPANILHVSKNQNASTFAYITNETNDTAARSGIIIGSSSATTASLQYLNANYTATGALEPATTVLAAGSDSTNGLTLLTTASAPIQFWPGGGSTPKVTMLSSGNVGVGTTSPEVPVDVRRDANSFTAVRARNFNLGIDSYAGTIGESDSTAIEMVAYSSTNTNVFGSLSAADSVAVRSWSGKPTTNMFMGTGSAAPLHLITNNAPRMTVLDTGMVGVGTLTPTSRLHVAGSVAIDSPNIPLIFNETDQTGNGKYWRMVLDSKNLRFDRDPNGDGSFTAYHTPLQMGADGTLTVNGNVYPVGDGVLDLGRATNRMRFIYASNGTIQTSDGRLKKDIQNSNLGLDFILSLQPVSYRWKSSAQGQDTHFGFIAQDLEAKIQRFGGLTESGIINYDKESDRYGVNYAELIAPVVKSVQELHGLCQAREEQLRGIDSRLQQQDRRIASLEKDKSTKDLELERLRKENQDLKKRLEKIEKHLGL